MASCHGTSIGSRNISVLKWEKFYNIIGDYPVLYDYQTLYAKLFGKTGVYIMSKDEVLKDIKRFVEQMQLYA